MRWWLGLVRLAFHNLRINKLRSTLTILGMVFGTGAVIATLSSSEGAATYIRAELEKLGTKTLVARLKEPGFSFQEEDLSVVRKYSDLFEALLMNVEVTGAAVSAKSQLADNVPVVGVEPIFFNSVQLEIARGRGFDQPEQLSAAPVAVLGGQLKKQLFGSYSAIGKYAHLFIGDVSLPVRVIGVLREKGGTSAQIDSSAFVPITLARKLAPDPALFSSFIAVLKNEDHSTQARSQILSVLSRRYASLIDISDSREAIERTKRIWGRQNLVGLCLAFISLITGGVGIMNIMLLSVSQRRKEIGIRKAVGAADHHILLQFLLEAVIVCFFGGVLGIAVGFAFGQHVARMMGDWDAVISISTIVSSLLFSMLTGVVFGLLPALRAAKIDPYEALRG